MNANVTKWIRRVLSAGLTLWAAYYIIEQVKDEGVSLPSPLSFAQLLWLAGAVGLAVVNLWVEAFKWKTTFRDVFTMAGGMAWKGVFLGAAVSFFMPNRLGEYSARVLVMPSRLRLAGLGGSFLNSTAVGLVTVIWGGMAAWHAFVTLPAPASWPALSPPTGGQWLGIGAMAVPAAAFICMRYLPAWARRIAAQWKQAEPTIRPVFSWGVMGRVALLTVVRFAVYCLQLYLLLRAAGVHLPVSSAVWMIPAFFFWTSVLPTFAAIDVPVRVMIGIWLFLPLAPSASVTAVVWASTILWLINVVLPILPGIVIGWKIWRSASFKWVTTP